MSKLKLNYRQKHNLPNILKSIKKGELGITKIAKKFNTSPQTLKKIAKAHNLEIADKRRVSRADKKRNDKIIELLTTQKYT